MARAVKIETERHFARQAARCRAGNIVSAHPAQLVGEIAAVLLLGEIRHAAAAADDHAPGLLFFEAESAPANARVAQRFLGSRAEQRRGAADAARRGRARAVL